MIPYIANTPKSATDSDFRGHPLNVCGTPPPPRQLMVDPLDSRVSTDPDH